MTKPGADADGIAEIEGRSLHEMPGLRRMVLTCAILGQMIQHVHDAALQLSHQNKEGRVRVRKRQWAQLERFFSLN